MMNRMKINHFLILPALLLAVASSLSCGCGKEGGKEEPAVELELPGNPFLTDLYLADPSAHVWAAGKLYLYP